MEDLMVLYDAGVRKSSGLHCTAMNIFVFMRRATVPIEHGREHEWFNIIQLPEKHSPLPEGTILLL
jgi:hypothetical protein